MNMNVYFMLGMPSDMDSSVTNQLCDNEFMDITLCGDCVDGNRWYEYYYEIDIRPIKGDYVQIDDIHRFVVDKVVIHMPGCDDSFDITVECLLDVDYYNGNA